MKNFFIGLSRLPIFWQIWSFFILVVNGVGPLFFLDKSVAIVLMVSTIVSAAVGFILVSVQGFTKLLGLMHAPWVPALVLQLIVFSNESPEGDFAKWLLTSIFITVVSLTIDVFDVILFLNGNKTDLLDNQNVGDVMNTP